MKDLVVLAADKDIEHTLKGLFTRSQALGIRPIDVDIYVHPQHDPACALRGVAFLSNFAEQYHHGLLIFDHEGSGKEHVEPKQLQKSLDQGFSSSTWGERARAIVLSPELEAWVWSDSPEVDYVAGWKSRKPPLRSWLVEQGWLLEGELKPKRPKETFLAALYETRTPRSSSLYRQLASRVSLASCADRSFREFKRLLRGWFPEDRSPGQRRPFPDG